MSTKSSDATEELARPVIRLLLGVVAVYVLRGLIGIIPGTEQAIPETPITIGAGLTAVLTLLLVVFVANFGRDLRPRLRRLIGGPDDVVTDVAYAAQYVMYAVAVIIAYDGLSAAVIPFLVPDPGANVYDLVFFAATAIPLVLAVARGYQHFNAIVDIITQQVLNTTSATVECPECGNDVRESQDFCSECGTDVSELTAEVTQTTPDTCPECNADVSPSDDFCPGCGHDLKGDDTDPPAGTATDD